MCGEAPEAVIRLENYTSSLGAWKPYPPPPMYSRPGKSSHDLLSDSQSNSISRDTVGPEDAFRGFPSNSSPS